MAVKRVDFGDLLDLDGEQPAGQEAPGGGGRCSRARASGRNTAVRLSRMQVGGVLPRGYSTVGHGPARCL